MGFILRHRVFLILPGSCKPKSGLQQAIVNVKQDYLTQV